MVTRVGGAVDGVGLCVLWAWVLECGSVGSARCFTGVKGLVCGACDRQDCVVSADCRAA